MTLDQILDDRCVQLFRGPAGHDKQKRMIAEVAPLMKGNVPVLAVDFKSSWTPDNSVPGIAVLQFPDPDKLPDLVREMPRESILLLDGVQFMSFHTIRTDLPVAWQVRYVSEALDVADERDIKVFATWSEV